MTRMSGALFNIVEANLAKGVEMMVGPKYPMRQMRKNIAMSPSPGICPKPRKFKWSKKESAYATMA